ncbi:MAG: tyrosine--tRNA ligase [Parcubacteria group bacterium]|nr:tyrosine--tRNA ligase [Parcubacteria group bacterium]
MAKKQAKTYELLTRGVAKAIPQNLAEEKLASGRKLRVYWGIDPTGTRMHLGHTIPMRKLMQFADAGHEAILIIGSFTAMLGDPSDKDAMRKPLTREQVQSNFETYKKQAAKVLDFSKIDVRYNHEWLEKLTYEDIMKHASLFTVQQMEQRDAFECRIKKGNPLGIHEFLYPMMVGYDSVVLDVDFEIGGTDQEFNMLAGRTMQKAFGKRDKCVLTTPLIEGTDGRLMSKTYDNCVYLDDEPADMYGKIMSLSDGLIVTYFELCTDVPLDAIRQIERELKKGENPRDAKARLALEIVGMYHGAKAAQAAEKEFNAVFRSGALPSDIPKKKVSGKQKQADELLVALGLAQSRSEAKRLIEQGGVRVDDALVSDWKAKIDVNKGAIIQVGKRRFAEIS